MKSRITVLAMCCIGATIAVFAARERVSAQEQPAPNGAALFSANCGACHGSDGRSGERAPNIATRREVVTLSDADLIRTVENGLAGNGMPAFGYLGRRKVAAIVQHLRLLQGIGAPVSVPGDPHAGEALFYGKANCSNCHMMNGRGGFGASELNGFGLGKSAQDVRAAIVDPDRKLEKTGQHVTVVSGDGRRSTGFVRTEDNFSLVLQTDDGAFHLFTKDGIARVEYSGHSSMPRDYESRLSSKELDDLVSYLLKAGAVRRRAVQDDDE